MDLVSTKSVKANVGGMHILHPGTIDVITSLIKHVFGGCN
jgi:hypothetical protein